MSIQISVIMEFSKNNLTMAFTGMICQTVYMKPPYKTLKNPAIVSQLILQMKLQVLRFVLVKINHV